MPSVAQISYFKASEGYKSGSINLNGPLSQISKANGLKQSYVGYQTEDDSVVFWVNGISLISSLPGKAVLEISLPVVDWVTKDACDTFAKQDDYAGVDAASRPAFASEAIINYVEFEDATGALGAPITEFVTFTLKEGNSMAQLEPLVQELHRKLTGTPKFHGDSWAPVIGKRDVYHGILGWDTVEAHWNAVKDGSLKEVIDLVKQIADLWLVHAALKRFSV